MQDKTSQDIYLPIMGIGSLTQAKDHCTEAFNKKEKIEQQYEISEFPYSYKRKTCRKVHKTIIDFEQLFEQLPRHAMMKKRAESVDWLVKHSLFQKMFKKPAHTVF